MHSIARSSTNFKGSPMTTPSWSSTIALTVPFVFMNPCQPTASWSQGYLLQILCNNGPMDRQGLYGARCNYHPMFMARAYEDADHRCIVNVVS